MAKKFELLHNVVNETTRAELEAKGEKCISVEDVRIFLNSAKGEDIEFEISSLGGDLAPAILIHDLIKAYPGKTIARITGLTASAGTVIAEACDEVVMTDNSLFLIHNGWGTVTGNVYDFQKAIGDFTKTDAIMVKIYREKTGMNDSKITELMQASDWLSPSEALEYGFIDRIVPVDMKIAASVIISGAQGKINNELLTKLKTKMKIFGKEKDPKQVLNTLALKDGNSLLINAEEADKGVEVTPLGAMTLEDGEYELADGRKITVAGGVITDVIEMAPAGNADAGTETVINTVAKMLVENQVKIDAKFEAINKILAGITSNHQPAKGPGPINQLANTGNASIDMDAIQTKVEAKMAEIRAEADKKRKGA